MDYSYFGVYIGVPLFRETTIYGTTELPILWFHIPCIVTVYGTSNELQNDSGNYLGPCSRLG